MLVAWIAEHLHLGGLQGGRPRDGRVLEPAIEVRDEPGGGTVVDLPQRGDCASSPGLDGDACQAQRSPVVALRRVARAQGEQLQRIVAKLEQTDELLESIHRQLAVERQEERLAWLAAELTVRCYVQDRVLLLLQRLLELRDDELPVDQGSALVDFAEGLELRRDIRQGGKALHGFRHADREHLRPFALDW